MAHRAICWGDGNISGIKGGMRPGRNGLASEALKVDNTRDWDSDVTMASREQSTAAEGIHAHMSFGNIVRTGGCCQNGGCRGDPQKIDPT